MNRLILFGVACRVIVLVAALVLATSGGWYLLWLLLVPPLIWDLVKLFRPTLAGSAATKFTEAGDYRVVLQVPGSNPVMVIREVRRTTGLGLLEAKQLTEAAPAVVVEKLSKQSAELVADRLRAAGARAVAAPIGDVT